jgi:hypothetical protein
LENATMLAEATSPQTAATAALEDPTRRRQKPCPPRGNRNFHPTVQPVLADGLPAYEVGLSGGLGSRETMLIDREDWHWVSTSVTPVWVVNRDGSRAYGYVCSGCRAAGYAAGIFKPRPRVNLHVLLAARGRDIKDNEAVAFINGDRRDLRRANLLAIPRSDVRRHVSTGARAWVVPDEQEVVH